MQFATNIGEAVSQGLEFEAGYYPGNGFSLFVNGSLNDTEITELTPEEAAISGAELGLQLAMPNFQGAATARYDYNVGEMDAFFSGTAAYSVISRPCCQMCRANQMCRPRPSIIPTPTPS